MLLLMISFKSRIGSPAALRAYNISNLAEGLRFLVKFRTMHGNWDGHPYRFIYDNRASTEDKCVSLSHLISLSLTHKTFTARLKT